MLSGRQAGLRLAALMACDIFYRVVGQDDACGDPFTDGLADDLEGLGDGDDDLQAVPADPSGTGGRTQGGVGLLSQTVTSMQPSWISRVSRLGPGAYLRVLVTSSLTTSSTTLRARSETGRPWTPCMSARNERAMRRASAISSVPSNRTERGGMGERRVPVDFLRCLVHGLGPFCFRPSGLERRRPRPPRTLRGTHPYVQVVVE